MKVLDIVNNKLINNINKDYEVTSSNTSLL